MKSKKCKNKKGKQGFSSILVVTKSSFLRRFALMTKIVLLRTYFLGPKIKPGYIWGGGVNLLGFLSKRKWFCLIQMHAICITIMASTLNLWWVDILVQGQDEVQLLWHMPKALRARSCSGYWGSNLRKIKKASTPPKNGGNKMVFWDYLFRSTKKCN